jgi:hypothetical protein
LEPPAEAAGAPARLRLSLAEDSPPALEGAPRPAFEDRPPLLTPRTALALCSPEPLG